MFRSIVMALSCCLGVRLCQAATAQSTTSPLNWELTLSELSDLAREAYDLWLAEHLSESQFEQPSFTNLESDPDGDGQSNFFEFVADLNPVDRDLRFHLEFKEGDVTRLRFWPLREGVSCEIAYSLDGKSWSVLDEDLVSRFGDEAAADVSSLPDGALYSVKLAGGLPATYRLIEAGVFYMGSPEDEEGRSTSETRHEVTLTRSFRIGRTEVTNGQVVKILNWALEEGLIDVDEETGSVRNQEGDPQPLLYYDNRYTPIRFDGDSFVVQRGYENYPSGRISRYGALAYCHYLTRMEGGVQQAVDLATWRVDFRKTGYRLPTEAEWEYACRAGTTTARYADLESAGWYRENSGSRAHEVGQKLANPWGLYDTHGNLFEWVYDGFVEFDEEPAVDPVLSGEGVYVFKGGNYFASARYSRSAHRGWNSPDTMRDDFGFRVAATSGLETIPYVDAGKDAQAIDEDGNGSATVALDGSQSKDPDGSIVSWKWSWPGGAASGARVEVAMPVGVNEVTLSVTDDESNQSSDTITVIVYEYVPPQIGQVVVPAGSFVMGSPSTEIGRVGGRVETQHQVTLTRDVSIGRTEVTNAEFVEVYNWALMNGLLLVAPGGVANAEGDSQTLMRFEDTNGQVYPGPTGFEYAVGKGAYPCVGVSWYGAMAYCSYRSRMENDESLAVDLSDWTIDLESTGYRLPTEAEWEYACRAGVNTAFYTGEIKETGRTRLDESLDQAGWYAGNSSGRIFPVGQKAANAFGLFDMHGNVWEWCFDSEGDYDGDAIDPTGAGAESIYRILRGGSWDAAAKDCRSAKRHWTFPWNRHETLGFRVVKSIP
ncbi:SUMF1/EgtB/PvdO family nonheme iron enzyme [Pelagicoccus sp. SDUM812003]|uniref:SUMF1/EgtB/PvdO family nonheme iron enzyme n=1 Tax=Pelagicoccus sp. SDUM812003 TaxID=3041267 RepID=UPI00280D90AD|nr:SUMF1/EgtB/PvdO family nonheme iron enzyme [Pelagicoccus sp. SDUM812003]MDQ8205670.1 SUMF1/EgtB/PvdO family nonheme iron enzyme [Pelagicoccus sp. SDUM812003]